MPLTMRSGAPGSSDLTAASVLGSGISWSRRPLYDARSAAVAGRRHRPERGCSRLTQKHRHADVLDFLAERFVPAAAVDALERQVAGTVDDLAAGLSVLDAQRRILGAGRDDLQRA